MRNRLVCLPASFVGIFLFIVLLSPVTRSSASDARLLENTIDVASGLGLSDFPSRTIYRSKYDPNHFYYSPAPLRIAPGPDGRPQFTLYRYNLVYNNGNFENLSENISRGRIYQGGTLKATFTNGLSAPELSNLENALRQRGLASSPRLSILPAVKSSFSLLVSDPEEPQGAKIAIGPFTVPGETGVVSIQEPLSVLATDVLYANLTGRFASGQPARISNTPISVAQSWETGGRGLDGTVRVTGNWENLYSATSDLFEQNGGYWFHHGNGGYAEMLNRLLQASNIQIQNDGDIPEEMRHTLNADVAQNLLNMAFDLGPTQPAEGSGTSENGQRISGIHKSELASFRTKAVSRQRVGAIENNANFLSTVSRRENRVTVLPTQQITEDRNVLVVNPSDWAVARVLVEVQPVVAPFFVQQVGNGVYRPHMVIATVGGSSFPAPVSPGGGYQDFGPFPNGGSPNVRIRWSFPTAPWPLLRDDLNFTDNRVAAAWSAIQTTLRRKYAGQGSLGVDLDMDLRLMSSVSLSSSMLPLVPKKAEFSFSVFSRDTKTYDWFAQDNVIVLLVEQEIRGLASPMRIPLKQIKMSGPVTQSYEWTETLLLDGPDVLKTRLLAGTIIVKKSDGSRAIKQRVILTDDLPTGGPVTIDIDPFLR